MPSTAAVVDLAVISGSGFYDFPELEERETIECRTRFGEVKVLLGRKHGRGVAFLARHREGHAFLPNSINYRANLLALKNLGVKALLSTTICGILDPEMPLARVVVFSDIFFPDNRLPDGALCTVYDRPGDPLRGHYLFAQPFSSTMREGLLASAPNALDRGVYAHVNGPRFNSAPEINWLRVHAHCVSQTAGPEVVLAGELEIPCALLGFGVDYANGVQDEPTPVRTLSDNLKRSREAFVRTIEGYIKRFSEPEFSGYVYRFE